MPLCPEQEQAMKSLLVRYGVTKSQVWTKLDSMKYRILHNDVQILKYRLVWNLEAYSSRHGSRHITIMAPTWLWKWTQQPKTYNVVNTTYNELHPLTKGLTYTVKEKR